MFGYIASDDTVYCCAVGRSIVGSRKSDYSSFMFVDRRQQIWSNSIESCVKRVDEQSSAVSPVPQPTTPRGIDRWAAFAWFHVPRCFCNANPLFSLSLRAAVVALEGRWLPRSSRPIRQACGGVSYGMVCHSCGFWLVTKPDSFLGTLHCFWRYPLNDSENSAPLYCDLVCANFPGRLENGEVPRKNPERRLKQ